MNILNFKCKLLYSLIGIGVISTVNGQFVTNFTIPGGIKDPQYTNLSAFGSIEFDFNNELASISLTHNSSFFNTNNTSTLTGILVLAPLGVSNLSLNTISELNWSSPPSNSTDPFPQAKNVGFTVDRNDYFGVGADNVNDGLESPSSKQIDFTFTFDFDGSNQATVWNNYLSSQEPHVFVRWQSLFEDKDNGFEGSTIGWSGGGDIPVIPVPEPSQIAALSIVGLGALLMIRRRIKAKRAAKA
jgi:hypothetical protein